MCPLLGSTPYLFREPWGVSTTTSMSTADSLNQCCYPGLHRHTPATRRSYHGHKGLTRAGTPAGPSRRRSLAAPVAGNADPAFTARRSRRVPGPAGGRAAPPRGRAPPPRPPPPGGRPPAPAPPPPPPPAPPRAVGRLALAAAPPRDQVDQPGRVAPEQQARDRPHSATSSARLHDITRMPIPPGSRSPAARRRQPR